jgi:hypothetical protein
MHDARSFFACGAVAGGGGGAGMASIARPKLDSKLKHLAEYQIDPGDLEMCKNSDGGDFKLGKGAGLVRCSSRSSCASRDSSPSRVS